MPCPGGPLERVLAAHLGHVRSPPTLECEVPILWQSTLGLVAYFASTLNSHVRICAKQEPLLLPVEAVLRAQELCRLVVTNRYSPPSSASLWSFSRGTANRAATSVSTDAPWGIRPCPFDAPTRVGWDRCCSDAIGRPIIVRASEIETVWTLPDTLGRCVGGDGGCQARALSH